MSMGTRPFLSNQKKTHPPILAQVFVHMNGIIASASESESGEDVAPRRKFAKRRVRKIADEVSVVVVSDDEPVFPRPFGSAAQNVLDSWPTTPARIGTGLIVAIFILTWQVAQVGLSDPATNAYQDIISGRLTPASRGSHVINYHIRQATWLDPVPYGDGGVPPDIRSKVPDGPKYAGCLHLWTRILPAMKAGLLQVAFCIFSMVGTSSGFVAHLKGFQPLVQCSLLFRGRVARRHRLHRANSWSLRRSLPL